MMSKQTATAMILSLAVGATSFPGAASGQLPSASTAALATANNYTALARGFAATALNPAGLAMPGNPGFSMSFPLFPIEVRTGLTALTLKELAEFGGIVLPLETKEDWLDRVIAENGFTTRVGAAVTEFALSVGRVGFQISTVGVENSTIAADAFELYLFGNAGRTGTPRNMTLAGTQVDGWAATTAALAFGIPLPDFQNGSFGAGATLKYTIGHVLVSGGDDGTSVLRANPVSLDLSLPSIAPDSLTFDNGTGVGLDLALAWEDSTWAVSAVVQNVFNTFQWKLENLAFRPGLLLVDGTSVSDDFDAVPATSAPQAFQDEILARSFDPVLILGLAYRVSDKLALTADFQKDTGETLVRGEGSHVGVGAEFRGVSFLPLRGGMSFISGGAIHFAAGFGLELGPLHLSAAYLTEKNSDGEMRAATVAMSFSHH